MKTIPCIKLPVGVRLLQAIEFPHKLGIMERLWASKLAHAGICWCQTAAGLPWKLDLRGSTHRWIVYGQYEGPGFLRWAKSFLPPSGVIVDSGANIGQMLLYLGQLVPRGKVLAFEPGTAQANWLAECLQANPQLPVELVRKGLSDRPADLFLQDDGADLTHGGQSMISDSRGAPVKVVRLEDELKERKIDTLDLWKLDVEGHEIQAMEGVRSWLEQRRVRALYVELHADNGIRIRDYLTTLGYQAFQIDAYGRPQLLGELPEHTNGLFLSRR